MTLAACLPAYAQDLAGQVIDVIEDDTLVIEDGRRTYRVRAIEIDAPHLDQPCGKIAKGYLESLCMRPPVRVRVLLPERNSLFMGQIVCDDTAVRTAMVEAGLAWVSRRYSRDRILRASETKAHQKQLRLWSDGRPVPPWRFKPDPNDPVSPPVFPFHHRRVST